MVSLRFSLTVIAVTDTQEGYRIVTSSERGVLRPEVRAILGPMDIGQVMGESGIHAEVKGIALAVQLKLKPLLVASNGRICEDCARFLDRVGIPYADCTS